MTSSSRMTERMKTWTSGEPVPGTCRQNTLKGSRVFSFFGANPSAGDSSTATPVRCFEASASG